MQVDFSSDYFELFDQPAGFELSLDALTQRYRQWQRVLHPDRFAAASDAERRWSVQAASLINQGYQTLKDPLTRATYLLSLHGIELNEETDTQMDPMFLMQQMEWRESLEAMAGSDNPSSAGLSLDHELQAATEEHTADFIKAAAQARQVGGDTPAAQAHWVEARRIVRQWQFLARMRQDLRRNLHRGAARTSA